MRGAAGSFLEHAGDEPFCFSCGAPRWRVGMLRTPPGTVGIAGAGLLGRLLAWRLARAGCRVAVFDVANGPAPLVRSQAPEGFIPTAAGFTAAGMLSPISELDNAEPAVAALGWRSLQLWPRIAHQLRASALVSVRGSLLLAHRGDAGAAQRVLDRLRAAMQTAVWQRLSPPAGMRALDPAALQDMEPALHGAAQAWLLPGEGQVDTVAAMNALHAAAAQVRWHWRAAVAHCRAAGGRGELVLADGSRHAFDAVVDARGVGARPDLPVRGVRGEIVWLHCSAHGLQRPVRLLHPRHRVYLVPRTPDTVLVGASEIESEDRSPVSLRTAVELLAAAHSVMPALAEARILKMDVNLRPALPDNNPLLDWEPGLLRINGLFRHGWLLAPALVEQALTRSGWGGGVPGAPDAEREAA